MVQAVFYGLGADGTVGANKNSVKIIAEDAGLYAQGYFVYDLHKSGAQTISHLRFGPRPIQAPYLIQQASFVGCHQFQFIERQDVLRLAAPGRHGAAERAVSARTRSGTSCRARCSCASSSSGCGCYVIDASRVAQEVGLRGRTNTVLQTCFFAHLRRAAARRGDRRISSTRSARPTAARATTVVQANFRAVDGTLARLFEVHGAGGGHQPTGNARRRCRRTRRHFVREVTAAMLEGRGDEIPVSRMPVDGTWPSGTAVWEKRNIADDGAGLGRRTPASSAASAASSARMA